MIDCRGSTFEGNSTVEAVSIKQKIMREWECVVWRMCRCESLVELLFNKDLIYDGKARDEHIQMNGKHKTRTNAINFYAQINIVFLASISRSLTLTTELAFFLNFFAFIISSA